MGPIKVTLPILVSFGLGFVAPFVPGQTIIYVDDDAALGGNGGAWATAYRYLQDALSTATTGAEIRISGGTYPPDQDEAGNVVPGDRAATFQLVSGVSLYGGYAGLANPGEPDERDLELYETTLSGDLNGDDGPDFENNGENSCHVVTGNTTGGTAILDGLTITSGNANACANFEGGGVLAGSGGLSLNDCTLADNAAILGGALSGGTGNLTLRNSALVHNWATEGSGGGVCASVSGNLALIDCKLLANSSNGDGGGVSAYGYPSFTNCIFAGNSAGASGGGLQVDGGTASLINCIFSGNQAETGGGISCLDVGGAVMSNCTFSENVASALGGGVYYFTAADLLVVNSILWGNGDSGGTDESGQIHDGGWGNIAVDYTCVHGLTGGLGGVGNIGQDPLFTDADGPDDLVGTGDDNLRLRAGSPCIDTGSNADVWIQLDLDRNPRITDGDGDGTYIVDMGAYEHPHQPPIPAVSSWGLLITVLLGTTAGTIMFRRTIGQTA